MLCLIQLTIIDDEFIVNNFTRLRLILYLDITSMSDVQERKNFIFLFINDMNYCKQIYLF